MKRVRILALSMLLILSLLLAVPGLAVELVMVESMTSPQRSEILQQIIDNFQQENPDITIELISPPMEGADQKIRQMLMNQNPVDILEVRDWTVLEFSQNGYLEPLDSYIDGWEHKETLTENFKETGTRTGGKYYLAPYGFYQKMLYYRSDWLEEAGLSVPTTYDELLDVCTKLTDPSNGRYGWTLRGTGGGAAMMNEILMAKLGKDRLVLTDDYFLTDGSTIFSTPEALEAFNMMIEFYTKASPKDSISWGFPDQCQAFTSGTTAFLQQDPEVVALCEEQMEPGTWATCSVAVDSETNQAPLSVGFAGWGITSYSENKDAAWKFLSYLENPENNAIFCEKYSVIPVHTNAGDINEFFKSGPFAPYMDMNAKPDSYFIVSGPEKYAENQEFSVMCDADYQNVLQGKLTPEDALKNWDSYWLEIKAKYAAE